MKHRYRQPATLVVAVLALVGVLAGVASALPTDSPRKEAKASTRITARELRQRTEIAAEAGQHLKGSLAREAAAQDRLVVLKAVAYNKLVTDLHIADYFNKLEQQAREQAAREAAARAQAARAPRTTATSSGTGRCGGDLPPCCVMNRESGGSLTARNPSSSAAGKWQFLSSTWGGYGGYASAADAPESVQDARARELWAGGAGASHWGGGC